MIPWRWQLLLLLRQEGPWTAGEIEALGAESDQLHALRSETEDNNF